MIPSPPLSGPAVETAGERGFEVLVTESVLLFSMVNLHLWVWLPVPYYPVGPQWPNSFGGDPPSVFLIGESSQLRGKVQGVSLHQVRLIRTNPPILAVGELYSIPVPTVHVLPPFEHLEFNTGRERFLELRVVVLSVALSDDDILGY